MHGTFLRVGQTVGRLSFFAGREGVGGGGRKGGGWLTVNLFPYAWPQLFLGDNDIGDVGAAELAKVLQVNSTLNKVP